MKNVSFKAILICICSLALVFGMGSMFSVFAATENIYVAEVNSVQYPNSLCDCLICFAWVTELVLRCEP